MVKRNLALVLVFVYIYASTVQISLAGMSAYGTHDDPNTTTASMLLSPTPFCLPVQDNWILSFSQMTVCIPSRASTAVATPIRTNLSDLQFNAITATATDTPIAPPPVFVYHVIRPGDSLSSIAAAYGVTVGDILRYNNISNPSILRIGQTLMLRRVDPMLAAPVVNATATDAMNRSQDTALAQVTIDPNAYPRSTMSPAKPVPTAKAPCRVAVVVRYYTVRPGDTLYGIAARFGITVSEIRQRNVLQSNAIYLGQRLAIDVPPVVREVAYLVQPDENLSEIAALFNVTEESIIQLNSLVGDLEPGQVLCIPPSDRRQNEESTSPSPTRVP